MNSFSPMRCLHGLSMHSATKGGFFQITRFLIENTRDTPLRQTDSRTDMKARPGNNDRFVIIMAGGRGERFWPVSRQATPKQLITLLGKRSFLQQAVDRVLPVVPLKNIIIITNAAQAEAVRRQLPKIPKENIIAEPCGRDTCAAVTLG